MTTIKIHDTKCWRCGITKNITEHHAIPQRMKPENNVIVPICKKCHDEINYQDIAGLYSFAFNLNKQAKQIKSNTGMFLNQFNNHINSTKDSKPLNKRTQI